MYIYLSIENITKDIKWYSSKAFLKFVEIKFDY